MNRLLYIRNQFRIHLRIFLFILLPFHSLSQINNDCGSATVLESAPAVFNIAGGITGVTTYTSVAGLPGCGTTDTHVWYTFVAHSSNPTISVTQTSGSAVIRRWQLFSGVDCASLVSISCHSVNSFTFSNLTPGARYYIRVYSSSGTF